METNEWSGAKRAKIPRHRRERLKPADITVARGIGRTTVWRVLRMDDAPEPDAFGTYSAAEIHAFFDSLTRERLRAAREREDAKRLAQRVERQSRTTNP